MRSPYHDSEFSRNLRRLEADAPGPFEPELGSFDDVSEAAAPTKHAGSATEESYKTGTTTVGLVASDGVVLASDQRASLGGQIVGNKNVQKIEEIQPNAALTIAGSVGGAQAFVRQSRAECNLYESRRGEYMSVEALATIMGNMLRAAGGAYLVSLVLGGVDEEGGQVFSLDPTGSSLSDTYTATGSGMPFAYGLLEQEYDEDLAVEEAVPVAARAIRGATERDTASGNGVHVAKVTAEGVDIEGFKEFDEVI